jgi:Fe-S-cluster containining protein
VIGDDTMRPARARAAQVFPDGTAPSASGLLDAGAARAGDDVCRTCGACCSYSNEWPRFSLESEARLALIPRDLVAEDEHGMRCTGGRCAALVGTVGQATSCAIHPVRPDVCRACSPGDAECREARRHFGLDEAPATTPSRRPHFRATDSTCQERRQT